jgi:hypothetical protein
MISPQEWTIGASEFYSVSIHCFSLPVLRFVSMAVMRSDDISDVIQAEPTGKLNLQAIQEKNSRKSSSSADQIFSPSDRLAGFPSIDRAAIPAYGFD